MATTGGRRRAGDDLRALYEGGAVAGLTDGQLLERFAGGSGPAFAALVDRHGAMVLRACRATLGDAHEAEDAFQATFLLLARRGASLRVADSVGPWLYTVARRVAAHAGKAAARRRAAERRAAGPDRAPAGGPPDDLAAAVLAELDRLPARDRDPVVLCDLEGRTHEEAARHLGCPVGTVKSRLARARARLRGRLARRGLGPAPPRSRQHGPRRRRPTWCDPPSWPRPAGRPRPPRPGWPREQRP